MFCKIVDKIVAFNLFSTLINFGNIMCSCNNLFGPTVIVGKYLFTPSNYVWGRWFGKFYLLSDQDVKSFCTFGNLKKKYLLRNVD
jgi:hypothetical protein